VERRDDCSRNAHGGLVNVHPTHLGVDGMNETTAPFDETSHE
jgi:hypothetical protein